MSVGRHNNGSRTRHLSQPVWRGGPTSEVFSPREYLGPYSPRVRRHPQWVPPTRGTQPALVTSTPSTHVNGRGNDRSASPSQEALPAAASHQPGVRRSLSSFPTCFGFPTRSAFVPQGDQPVLYAPGETGRRNSWALRRPPTFAQSRARPAALRRPKASLPLRDVPRGAC